MRPWHYRKGIGLDSALQKECHGIWEVMCSFWAYGFVLVVAASLCRPMAEIGLGRGSGVSLGSVRALTLQLPTLPRVTSRCHVPWKSVHYHLIRRVIVSLILWGYDLEPMIKSDDNRPTGQSQ